MQAEEDEGELVGKQKFRMQLAKRMKEDLDVRWSKIWNGERILEHCVMCNVIQMTKDISYVKYVERYSLQLQTCASISSPPWGETINWPQLVLIVAPVSIGKTQDGAHWWTNKKVFFFFKCVLMLFPLSSMNTLFTLAFLLC